jgi:hypothetical protein
MLQIWPREETRECIACLRRKEEMGDPEEGLPEWATTDNNQAPFGSQNATNSPKYNFKIIECVRHL